MNTANTTGATAAATAMQWRAFDFNEQAVRVVVRGGAPWFVAADVCRVLEIANSRDAVKALDGDEKADVGLTDTSSNGVNQRRSMTVISESGLYALVFKSRKPEARRFRRWVTGVVLPQIRETGSFSMPATAADAAPNALMRELLEVRELLLTSARAVRDKTLDVGRAQQVANLAARYLDTIKLECDARGYETVLGLRGGEATGGILPEQAAGAERVQGVPQPGVCGAAAEECGLPEEPVFSQEDLGGVESGTGESSPGEADLQRGEAEGADGVPVCAVGTADGDSDGDLNNGSATANDSSATANAAAAA